MIVWSFAESKFVFCVTDWEIVSGLCLFWLKVDGCTEILCHRCLITARLRAMLWRINPLITLKVVSIFCVLLVTGDPILSLFLKWLFDGRIVNFCDRIWLFLWWSMVQCLFVRLYVENFDISYASLYLCLVSIDVFHPCEFWRNAWIWLWIIRNC